MKKTLLALFLVSAVILGVAIGASASPATSVLIRIPFAFHAGDQLMPAGNYYFEMPGDGMFATGTMLRVSDPQGSHCQYLFSQSTARANTDTEWHVTFDKFGDTYFLSKVINSNHGAEVPMSRLEKKLAGRYLNGVGGLPGTIDHRAVHAKAK